MGESTNMEERRDEYGFCPKCGAITQNGVCQSCGFGKRPGMPSEPVGSSGEIPGRKKGMSAGGKIVIGLIILLVVLLAAFAILTVRAVMDRAKETNPIIGDGFFDGFEGDYDGYEADDDWWDDYEYNSSYEEYVPSPDDEYYEEITNATRQDLSYGIEWHTDSWYPDADEDYTYNSVSYPVLTGDFEEKLGSVNEKIHELAYSDRDSFGDYADGISIDGYVTYMSEDRLSVVFWCSMYGDDGAQSRLTALNFDMSTGELIPYGDMIQVDDGLVKKFRSQDSVQNGGVAYVLGLTDEELLDCLQDDSRRVLFYTPVGLELGLNYENSAGWVTVTLKDDAL